MAEIIIPTDNTLILPSDDRTREVPSIVTDDELTLRKFQLLPEEHPILKKVGSRKALYLIPGHTIAIKGLSEDNSKELLKFLFNHQTKKEFQNSFFWEKNTIVIWDNHSVIHSATPFQGRRMMHRIILDA